MNVEIKYQGAPYWLEYQKLEFKKRVFHRDTLELVFVMKGQLTIEIDNEKTILGEGEFISINAGIPHELWGADDTYITSLYFDLIHYRKLYSYIRGISINCLYKKTDKKYYETYYVLRNCFIRLMVIENFQVPKAKILGTEICDIMIDILVHHIYDERYIKNKLVNMKKADVERMMSIGEFLQANYTRQGLSLADLAEHEKLSTTRLSHFWKSITTFSFMESIGLHRYNEARRYLMDSELPVSEISERCGYSDEKYLYKIFKQYHGMTPSQFRENYKSYLKMPSRYEPRDITEIFEILIIYWEKYYNEINDFSFLKGSSDRVEEAKQLHNLYSLITKAEKRKLEGEKIDINTCLFSFDKNSGLRYDGNKYMLNWEYVYTVTRLSINIFSKCSILVNSELMSNDQWMFFFHEIQSEFESKFGSDFNTSTRLVINYSDLSKKDKAMELAEQIEKTGYFADVRLMLYV